MAHIDRQPNDKVFDDIKSAALAVWYRSREHEDYVKERTDHIYSLTNYADNWYSMVGRMDIHNHMRFWHYLEYQETCDFLREMSKHYSYYVPSEKK